MPSLHLPHDGVATLMAAIFTQAERGETEDDALPPEPFWQYRDRAEIIGHLYLQQEPAEKDAAYLLQQLPELAADDDAVAADEIRKALAERRKADFIGGDTVQLDGWIIARTEARLCALAALIGA